MEFWESGVEVENLSESPGQWEKSLASSVIKLPVCTDNALHLPLALSHLSPAPRATLCL